MKFKVGDKVLNRNTFGEQRYTVFEIDLSNYPLIYGINCDFEPEKIWFCSEISLELAQSQLQQEEAKKLLGLKDV